MKIKSLFQLSSLFLLLFFNAQAQQKKPKETSKLMGNRFLTLNAVIRVNQIEVSRNRNVGEDERALHTPERVKAFRNAVTEGFPGGKMTWALSWLALQDTTAAYQEIRKIVIGYHHQYGDEITFIPGAYFANAYNTTEQVNKDIHDALSIISKMVGNGYRPKSIVAGFLSSENQQYLAEKEGIHVCQGIIWSQFSIDNQDGDGSVCYPFYPSKEHFCKPAQNAADFVDCVNLDGWSVDFLAGRRAGFAEGFNSRMGVGPIETIGKYGKEIGLKEMIHTTAIHFDKGYELNGFGWVTNCWEVSLPMDVASLKDWLTQVRARWPDTRLITQGEFGLRWRAHYKMNTFNYRFVERGSGIGGSDADKEISWYMNKDFRLALLKNPGKDTSAKVIDFTNYTIPAKEPAEMTRKWSLLGEINQKQTRPQDKPIPIDSLSAASQVLISKDYPQLLSSPKKK
ncbi:DUF3863 domain-containing protein [Mucilaginibacter sabulilitoris]|uniref:DUF3863 domain-containing protein n=1 Tax=Mucilaginibacter sabulilitoris TaxID=1173583 RepID=A0ABZ0THX9_9SPHI|nr:DUF3863 domain-containing protein [Mucilaginibacter sabulilitoris]WPU92801.1 DUF3863 domain-containing protein [Mucilaginibacter sabulilitoris]